jgi:hypothetical protein
MLNGHWIPDGPPFDGYVVQTKTTGWSQPGPIEVFIFDEIHEDVIDDGSFAQADPGSATSTATM